MTYRVKVLGTMVLLLVLGAYVAHRLMTNPEWQQFQTARFWQSLVQVRVSYALFAALMIFVSYFFRSIRWRAFLFPMRKGNLGNIFVSTLIGFSAVALVGRPGEFVRPFLIARKESLGVSSQLAVWTLERVFDSLTLGALMGVVLLLFPPGPDLIVGGSQAMAHLQTGGIVLRGGAVLAAVLLVLLRTHARTTIGFILRLAWLLPERYRERLRTMLGILRAAWQASRVFPASWPQPAARCWCGFRWCWHTGARRTPSDCRWSGWTWERLCCLW